MKQTNQREVAASEARERILTAAADCIVREGLAQVRMAGIAKAAGVSSGLVHYHFDTKERLFADVLTHSSQVSGALTESALREAGPDPAHRLSAFLDRCLPVDERLTHDWILWQELALLCMRDADLSRVAAELYAGLYAAVAAIVRDGIDQGVFRPAHEDLSMLAEAAVALCDGLGTRVLSAGPDLTLADARRTVATVVGRLVGHDGPLPLARRTPVGARA